MLICLTSEKVSALLHSIINEVCPREDSSVLDYVHKWLSLHDKALTCFCGWHCELCSDLC